MGRELGTDMLAHQNVHTSTLLLYHVVLMVYAQWSIEFKRLLSMARGGRIPYVRNFAHDGVGLVYFEDM
jgi:hypothetical protein